MFTGIIITTGEIAGLERRGDGARVRIAWPDAAALSTGDSVCVSGVCLTALDIDATGFSADLSAETLARTSLGDLGPGSRVNLEPALRAGDRLGGHFVTGHVDDTGRVVGRPDGDAAGTWRFSAPHGLMRYIAGKGSITVDGVSLTVNAVGGKGFDVTLIPHTLQATTLGERQVGDRINLEVDLLARYLERLNAAAEQ